MITTYNYSLESSKTHHVWAKPYFFNSAEIRKIDELALKQPKLGGLLAGNKTDDTIRTSEMCFLPSSDPDHEWIFKKVSDLTLTINNDIFKFDISSVESLQYTIYNEGAYYKDHVDITPYNVNGMRKLSFVIMLSEASDYNGGDLVLKYSSKPFIAPRNKGSVIFFPSYTLHEVTPVTKGLRKTLVGWVQGPNFK